MERRDHSRRADTLRRVVERLIEARNGLEPAELSAQGVVIESGAARILKRLMCQGLARLTNGRCRPTPVLLHAAPVRQCPVDEALQLYAARQQAYDEYQQRHRIG
jgi:hypothetical protein